MTEPLEHLNDTEAKTLLRAVNDPRDRAVITLFLTTGLFVNELIDLKTTDLNFDQKIINLTGTRPRQIPLNNQAIEALAQWTKARPTTPTETLFITQKGKVQNLSVRAIDKLIAKYSKQAGFKSKINAKILRNTFAINLFKDEKITLKTAGEILGISDYESIKKYQTSSQTPQSTDARPCVSTESTDTRPALDKMITNIFPTKPEIHHPVRANGGSPQQEIFGRDSIIKEIETCLTKKQSTLILAIWALAKRIS